MRRDNMFGSKHLQQGLKGSYKLIIALGYFSIVLAISTVFFGYLKLWNISTILSLLAIFLYLSCLMWLRKKRENSSVNFHYQVIKPLFIVIALFIFIIGIYIS